MDYFSNNMEVTFNEMKENVKYKEALKKENVRFDDLIEVLTNKEYGKLKTILDSTVVENASIMEPILYSVKNEYGTYKVYKYCGEKFQENLDLVIEIVKDEPELIKDTPISNNKVYILELAKVNPEVVIHMSQSLKANTEFIENLCELNNKEIIINIARECKMPDTIKKNPELANNKEFMTEAVKKELNVLKYASEELKNDYKFIKEVSTNKETVNYIVENAEDFGAKGLSGAKDALVEISSDEAIYGFEQEKEELKNKILDGQEEGKDKELEELLKRDKQLGRHIKFFERIKNGEVDPVRAAKLIDKICINMDEKYKEEIRNVLKLDEVIKAKEKENDKNNAITLESIENVTERASLEGTREETVAIRESIKQERESLINEVGEKDNDKTNDERA